VLLTGAHLHVQHQAQVAHQEGMQHVAGPHGLGRVVSNLRTFLAPVQRLDAGVLAADNYLERSATTIVSG
jgi:hypothetical protein